MAPRIRDYLEAPRTTRRKAIFSSNILVYLPALSQAEVLMTADPKVYTRTFSISTLLTQLQAFQHIFHKSGYNYPKSVHTIVDIKLLTGESIISAAREQIGNYVLIHRSSFHFSGGEDHSRHRKIMNPAFTASQLRSFLPFFRQSATKVCRLLLPHLIDV